ncbi:MAG: response regulator, partial [Chloroflexota bacterium]|nr:response regulator [Chloroflexota bacterium]
GLLRLPAPTRGESRGGRPGHRRRRILIVGHSAFERALLRRSFERSDCEVAEVDTGEAAVLEMACSGCVDAVLTTNALADGSGLALVRWVRAGHAHQCRDVPVLVLSGDDSDEFKVRAYDAGADMVVAKPIDLDVLHRKLLAISRSAARHEPARASGR